MSPILLLSLMAISSVVAIIFEVCAVIFLMAVSSVLAIILKVWVPQSCMWSRTWTISQWCSRHMAEEVVLVTTAGKIVSKEDHYH